MNSQSIQIALELFELKLRHIKVALVRVVPTVERLKSNATPRTFSSLKARFDTRTRL